MDARLRIRADRDACRGARACVRRAPGTFSLDAARKVVVATAPREPEAAILDAVRACPNFALEALRGEERVA